MKIEYRTGNLLEAPEKYIVHGCNSHGVMGSGVAAAIRAKYPEAFTVYRKVYEENGLKLGQCVRVDCGQHVVIDAITQKDFGRDPNVVYVSYDAIRSAVQWINQDAANHQVEAVGFPLIGAGLANGKWSIISQIIEEESTNFQPVVYLIDGVIPTT